MKKFKKLIPAFCAMLLSACMLGTTTYAWFSVNKTVTATGLSVTAQANTQYFVISDSETFADKVTYAFTAPTQGGIKATADNDAPTVNVYPAAYGKTTNGFGEAGWWTANVSEYDSTDDHKIINVDKLKAGSTTVYENEREYFVGYTFYLGLAQTSSDFNGQLKIKFNTADANAAKVAAVKFENVGVETSEGSGVNVAETIEVEKNDKGAAGAYTTTNSYTMTAAAANPGLATKYVKVTVYVFMDGNNALIIDSSTTLSGIIGLTVEAA
ncbi:MAG: hypothetical protein ACI4SC_04750 [Candidatus Neoclostridium sp.]